MCFQTQMPWSPAHSGSLRYSQWWLNDPCRQVCKTKSHERFCNFEVEILISTHSIVHTLQYQIFLHRLVEFVADSPGLSLLNVGLLTYRSIRLVKWTGIASHTPKWASVTLSSVFLKFPPFLQIFLKLYSFLSSFGPLVEQHWFCCTFLSFSCCVWIKI